MLKRITIEDARTSRKGRYIAIENERDLQEFFDYDFKKMEDDISNNIIAGEDHAYNLNIYAAALGSNPAFTAPGLLSEKRERFERHIRDGRIIIVNERGGYQFLEPERHRIIAASLFLPRQESLHLRHDAVELLFENDPVLDKQAKIFYERTGTPLSYITNLRDFSKEELEVIAKEFIADGGKRLRIFTTAEDLEQLDEYMEAAIEAGITEYRFHLTAGITQEIEKAFEKYVGNDEIDFKYQESKIS